jgi:fatty acid desaturase
LIRDGLTESHFPKVSHIQRVRVSRVPAGSNSQEQALLLLLPSTFTVGRTNSVDLLLVLIILLLLLGGGGGLYWGFGVGWGIGPIGLIILVIIVAWLLYGVRGRRGPPL